MTETRRVRSVAVASIGQLVSIAVAATWAATALADPPAVVDSQSIVRSLAPPAHLTRALSIEARTSDVGGSAGKNPGGTAGSNATTNAAEERRISLDIRFGNNSNQLSPSAHAQLEQLGAALSSPELAHTRFRIAGHTSATGAAEHNRELSESRARAVRQYLIDHSGIAPERLEAVGFGASRPLADYPANALQQRRVEISSLPPTS